MRQEELTAQFRDKDHANYLDPAGFDDAAEQGENIRLELEERDYYTEENVFWVLGLARWNNIKTNARIANGTEIEVRNGKTSKYKFTTLAKLMDDALEAIEKENPKLKGVLNKMFTQYQIDPAALAGALGRIQGAWFAQGQSDAATFAPADGFPADATLTRQGDVAQTHRFSESLQAPWQPVRDIWAMF